MSSQAFSLQPVKFQMGLPLPGRGDPAEGAAEEGDAHPLLPPGRRPEGSSVLRPGVGAVGPAQRQGHALQGPAAPSEEGVPAVCQLLREVPQHQRHAGKSHSEAYYF